MNWYKEARSAKCKPLGIFRRRIKGSFFGTNIEAHSPWLLRWIETPAGRRAVSLKKKNQNPRASIIPPQTLAPSAASELLLCRGHHKSSHSLLFTWHGAGTIRRPYRDLPTTTVHMSVGRSRISSEAIASGHLGALFIDHLTGIPHLATLFTGWLLVNEVKANRHWILQRTRLFLSRLAASPWTATLHKTG